MVIVYKYRAGLTGIGGIVFVILFRSDTLLLCFSLFL